LILQVSCAELHTAPVAALLLPGNAVKGNFMWYQARAGPKQGCELCRGAAQGAEPGPAQDKGQCLALQNLASAHPPSTHALASSQTSAVFLQIAVKAL